MKSLARAIVSVVAFAAVYFISYWLFFVQVLPDSLAWAQTGGALFLAMTLGWLIWFQMGKSSRGVPGTALVWSAVAGAIGFAGGFFGPMIFDPDAHQGPMLGLFITGPLGFIGGGICGAIYAWWRKSAGNE
jgi:hypothetical protein